VVVLVLASVLALAGVFLEGKVTSHNEVLLHLIGDLETLFT